GFVTELVAEGEALNAAKRFAAEIEKCSPVSIRTSLDVVRRGLEHASVKDAMISEYESVTVLRNS
ncbi:MAG: enoyl-CoA hydratase, partial [Pseudomonadota bacterium]|nr:enoyl-CoA hydratase [Pseudomonadota bacterium]